jgi:hypothetical protein
MTEVDPASAVRNLTIESTEPEKDGEATRDAADDAIDATTESHRAAEGAESMPSLSSRDGLKNALLRTTPNTRLSEVDSPWNPDEGGITRVYRGLQKALDFEGMPAIVDIVVGAAEYMSAFEPEGGEQENGGQQPSEPEPEGIGMELP